MNGHTISYNFIKSMTIVNKIQCNKTYYNKIP